MILTSGIHGVEGYTGSAVQLMLMDKLLQKESVDNLGILLIHSLNPYGMKYNRRVTESNVDLNRNCMISKELFDLNNSGFVSLNKTLTPNGAVNLHKLENKFFYITAIKNIISDGMPVLRQAILQGQYDYPEGIFYGGQDYDTIMRKH